jgi:uncharacterized membrane protein YdfJ with MMPL/SSD domain
MKKYPLYIYVIGVAVAWAIVLTLSWFGFIWKPFRDVVAVCVGFALGMLYMYLRIRVNMHSRIG